MIKYIKQHHLFPVIFILLKNKRAATYSKVCEILKALEGELLPHTILCDYWSAVMQAAQVAFPGIKISGCLFHFGQSVQRQIQERGNSVLYRENSSLWKFTEA
jgi:hypothetical protein